MIRTVLDFKVERVTPKGRPKLSYMDAISRDIKTNGLTGVNILDRKDWIMAVCFNGNLESGLPYYSVHWGNTADTLSPVHTVLWLSPHLIHAQPCQFFLQATRSSGSLHISFQLNPVHSFSRPHSPLAPSPSHSSSAPSKLSPGHTALWLPPHLIPAQPCPFFLQASRSSGSLHISFQLSPVHSFTSSNHCLAGLPRDLLKKTLANDYIKLLNPASCKK